MYSNSRLSDCNKHKGIARLETVVLNYKEMPNQMTNCIYQALDRVLSSMVFNLL